MVNQYQNNSFVDYNIKRGVIQLAFPQFGIYTLKPSLAGATKSIYATAPQQGDNQSISYTQALLPGTEVYYSAENNNTQRGVILSVNNNINQYKIDPYRLYRKLYFDSKDITANYSQKTTQFFWDELHNIFKKTFSVPVDKIADELLPGDFCISSGQGLQVFAGHSLFTIKASAFNYIEMSGITRTITALTDNFALLTADSQIQLKSGINKYKKASNLAESLGYLKEQGDVLQLKEQKVAEGDAYLYSLKLNAQLQKDNIQPLYRYQRFTGGILKGQNITILSTLQAEEKPEIFTVFSSCIAGDGSNTTTSVSAIRNIKAASFKGLINKQLTVQQLQKIEKVDEQAKKILKQDDNINNTEFSSVKHLLLQQLLNTPLSQILRIYVKDEKQLQALNKEQLVLGKALIQVLKDKKDKKQSAASISQQIPVQPVQLKEGQKKYINTSFISQQQDGSILIKDGWGSQIRMTKGNVYITSALDTFIQPGRDCIQLVPRNKSVTTNGQLVLTAQEKAMLVSQQDVVVASGISGEEGCTVIENRSSKNTQNTGMILRSNSNTSITATGDLFIGINDKRNKNAKDVATRSKGNIVIDTGGNLIFNADKAFKLTANTSAIYSVRNQKASGIEMSYSNIALISNKMQFATKYVQVGKTQKVFTNTKGISQETFTLSQGSTAKGRFRIKGDIVSQGIYMSGDLRNTGTIVAKNYVVLQKKSKKQIPGTSSAKAIKKHLAQLTNAQVPAYPLSKLQVSLPWYNDNYICQHQAMFMQSEQMSFASSFSFPMTCWQQQPLDDTKKFKFIYAKQTGQNKKSYVYPGQSAIKNGKILKWDNKKNKLSRLKLQKQYVTNSIKE